jgi:HK97 gp10 family phage protein
VADDIEFLGGEALAARLKQINNQASRLENSALRGGVKIILDEIEARAPRSDSPRQPYGKTNRWRTGRHAADILKVGNVRRVQGGKAIYAGLLKGDTSKAFYLKFHEWGTTKIPARPFMEPAAQEKEQEAVAEVARIIKEGLGL